MSGHCSWYIETWPRHIDFPFPNNSPMFSFLYSGAFDAFGHSLTMFSNDRSSTFWAWAELWRSGDANDRLCVAVDLASTLVHEATHCCGLYGFDLGRKPCPDSYTIGNNMKMAQLLR